MQPPRADILDAAVDLGGQVGDGFDGFGGEVQGDVLGGQQRLVLVDQAGFRLGQDAHQIVAGQGLKLDADRQAALQFGQKVRRLGQMESARGDEQHMIGLHRAMFGVHRGALRSAAAGRAARPHGRRRRP